MDLFEAINRRKSSRTYLEQPLCDDQLEEIVETIKEFEPLYQEVSLDYRFAKETKGAFHVPAPHYLIISGEGKKGEEESAGFLFEQLVLWFDMHDIGSVWLGKAKEVGAEQRKHDIITLAFGATADSVHRHESEFKRKPIEEITNAPSDDCIRAVHVAPSGMNLQPWYLEKNEEKILVYKQLLRPPVSLAYKKVDVDIGIALCHYAIACRHFDRPFHFQRCSGKSAKKGYELFGELF